MQFIIKNLGDLLSFSKYIQNHYWNNKIFLLSGDLGVGKTQLIKFLIPECNVTSPSFSFLNVYDHKYWHFDLYNKKNFSLWEMEELGFNSIWENDQIKCFIEWPEHLNFHLKTALIHLNFFYIDNNYRKIIIQEGIDNDRK